MIVSCRAEANVLHGAVTIRRHRQIRDKAATQQPGLACRRSRRRATGPKRCAFTLSYQTR